MTNRSVTPHQIAVSKSKGVTIEWQDGAKSEFDLRYLRDHCPCATCTGAHGTPSLEEQQSAQAANPFQMYHPSLKIEAVEPVGNYAIKIRWSDGHDTGIYTWEHLRSIAR